MTQSQIPQALQEATQHHQAGRLREAEAIYRQVLLIEPENPDALHLLGVLALQMGQHEMALGLIERAVAIHPDSPFYLCNLGQTLAALGRPDDAITRYRRALELQPDLADAYNSMGSVLLNQQRLTEAIDAFQKAIALQPGFAEAHSNLGNALASGGQHDLAIASFHQALALNPNKASVLSNLGSSLQAKGQISEAMTALRQAIALQPNLAEAHNNLGILLQTAGRLEPAIAEYRQALAMRPGFADAHSNLGSALQEIGKHEQAIAEYRVALSIHPDFPEVYNNLGGALRKTGRLDEAIAAFGEAISRRPNFYEPTINLGVALHDTGQFDQAIETFRRAIELKPDRPTAHVNLGMGLLLKGDFEHGWPEYEWRWQAGEFEYPHDDSGRPLWNGRPLNGQRILIETEHDPADTLQLARYLRGVAQLDGRIILACDAKLEELLRTNFPQVRTASRNEPLVEFETHCPLLSLPRIFRTTLQTIPAPVPYLRADSSKSKLWRERLSQFSEPLKIGLSGFPQVDGSLPPSLLAPLFETPGARFVNLQKSRPDSFELPCVDWTDELGDFSGTAALIDPLDLIITTDSPIAHLAAAMGKPTWLLLPVVPDWRWMLNRKDSPWYPTMRLFRQTQSGDWTGIINEVMNALKNFSNEASS